MRDAINSPAEAGYDPLNYETWPDEQKDFAGRVWREMHDGNLKPLAEYLRAGYCLDPALAREIADAIDRKDFGFFHIVPKGRIPGQRGFTQVSDEHDRKMRIGVFMEARMRSYGRGGYEAALTETCDKFSIKSSATVAKARKYVLDYVAKSQARPGFDLWAHLQELYFTP